MTRARALRSYYYRNRIFQILNNVSSPPTLVSAIITAEGTAMELTFDQVVVIGAGGHGEFDMTISSDTMTNATYSSGSGTNKFIYTLDRTVRAGESLLVIYNQPGNGIENTSGDDLDNINTAITNNSTQDITAPTLQSATIVESGSQIVLTFNEAVWSGASGGFSTSFSGGAASMSFDSGDNSTSLIYNFDRVIGAGEFCAIDYTQPGGGITDTAGNELSSFGAYEVINNSTAS